MTGRGAAVAALASVLLAGCASHEPPRSPAIGAAVVRGTQLCGLDSLVWKTNVLPRRPGDCVPFLGYVELGMP